MKKLSAMAIANVIALMFVQPVDAAPADEANDPGAQLGRVHIIELRKINE